MAQRSLNKHCRLVLRGDRNWGSIDPVSRIAYLKGDEIPIPGTKIYEVGESIRIEGEQFQIMNFSPSVFHMVARRGAQVIQPKDAAYMISRSGIGNGSVVLESGVGTGALTAHILWAIGESGSLLSVDSNAGAFDLAKRNLQQFYSLENWKTEVSDIGEFKSDRKFDAIFLDLPEPWRASALLEACTKRGSAAITYLPTFNQVEKTAGVFAEKGLTHEETVEIVARKILVRSGATRPENVPIGHTAFISVYRN